MALKRQVLVYRDRDTARLAGLGFDLLGRRFDLLVNAVTGSITYTPSHNVKNDRIRNKSLDGLQILIYEMRLSHPRADVRERSAEGP